MPSNRSISSEKAKSVNISLLPETDEVLQLVADLVYADRADTSVRKDGGGKRSASIRRLTEMFTALYALADELESQGRKTLSVGKFLDTFYSAFDD